MVVVIIFPIFALIGVQVVGYIYFTPLLTMALASGIVALDFLVLRIAVRLPDKSGQIIVMSCVCEI